MVGGRFLHQLHTVRTHGVDLFQSRHTLFCEHRDKLFKNPGSTLRIIHRTMMIVQGNPQGLGNGIQGVLGLVGQKHSGNPHGIHAGKLCGKSLPCRIFPDKAHIKTRIVSNQHTILREFQEPRKHLFNRRRIRHHIVPDAGQFLNLIRNRHPGIDKGRKSVHDLALGDLHRTNLYDLIGNR